MNTQQETKRKEKFYLNLQTAIDIGLEQTLPRADEILYTYLERYYDGGEITPIHTHKNAAKAASMIGYCNHNMDGAENVGMPEHSGERIIIAKGELSSDFNWENSDPYQTAGGYMKGIARKGTPATVFMRYEYHGWYIEIETDVSITYDHYNNNFFGNSTGGGTKKFEEGERVSKKTVATGDSMHVISSNLDNYFIDYQRVTDFIRSQEVDRHVPQGRVR